jgi:hypothetical protein
MYAGVPTSAFVLRLEVAMHEPGAMRGRETIADRRVELADLAPRARLRVQPRARGAAGEVLHRDEHATVDRADLVHDDDVRMRELRECLRLALDARERGLRHRDSDLERDRAVEPAIAREVDDTHRALAERALDLVLICHERARRERG